MASSTCRYEMQSQDSCREAESVCQHKADEAVMLARVLQIAPELQELAAEVVDSWQQDTAEDLHLRAAVEDLRVHEQTIGLQAEDLQEQETAHDLHLQVAVADLRVQEKVDGLEVADLQKQVPAESAPAGSCRMHACAGTDRWLKG